jgi:transposase InsO family protein
MLAVVGCRNVAQPLVKAATEGTEVAPALVRDVAGSVGASSREIRVTEGEVQTFARRVHVQPDRVRAIDDVFRSEGTEVLLTPVQAPNANAERWIRTVRAECLDWLLMVGRGHLEQVLGVYVEHYNTHRPHRALELQPPDPAVEPALRSKDQPAQVHRRDLLGGLVHEYRRAA